MHEDRREGIKKNLLERFIIIGLKGGEGWTKFNQKVIDFPFNIYINISIIKVVNLCEICGNKRKHSKINSSRNYLSRLRL